MHWGQFGLQDANSPVMEELVFLHDFINTVLVFIITFVGLIMLSMMFNKLPNQTLMESQVIECVWTIIPAVILVQIALPSLLLLYMLDESVETSLSVKVLGHQWYWSYEYSDFWATSESKLVEFDAYMLPEEGVDQFRLLDVDNRTVIPFMSNVRMLISSADVLHAWTVPALGVKADAVPGRLNQVQFTAQRPGIFFGQCSEICGANHSFMPIVIESVSAASFLNWIILSQD